MPTDVLMPQMGESIAEGTIVRWIKDVGEPVDRDEPLFEMSTDKVDAEVPSPAGGVLVQIRARAGETVPVNSVVAVIGAVGETVAAPAAPASPTAAAVEPASVEAAVPAPGPPPPAAPRARLSPVVRRLAAEHEVDLSLVAGTGDGGRITKVDVLAHVAARDQARPSAADGARIEPMSVMRRRIAEHMLESRRTSAHVHTLFEVDFSGVAAARAAYPDGTAPGYLAYIAKAVSEALAAMPVVNASVDGTNVVYHEADQRGDCGCPRLGPDRTGGQAGRSAGGRRHRRGHQGPRGAGAGEAARSRGRRGRHLHHHQSRQLRLPPRDAHHQPAPGGDSRRGCGGAAAGRRRRRRCRAAPGVPDPGLRPPADRRGDGRPVPGARQDGAGGSAVARRGGAGPERRARSSGPRLAARASSRRSRFGGGAPYRTGPPWTASAIS